jgi:hypothetical protein
VVTKNGKIPKGLENIPMNKLIVETSTPIGLARKRAIEQVTTRLFAFIDDDMIIGKYWFETMYLYIQMPDVGAVFGISQGSGFGPFSKYFSESQPFKELKFGDRLFTNDTLIKTNLVKDWNPTYGINWCEDLDIGNYIMSNKHRIFFIPTNIIHDKGWEGIKNSALWGGYRTREVYKINYFKELFRRILAPFKVMFLTGVPHGILCFYRNFYFMVGLTKSYFGDVKYLRKEKNEIT